MENKDKSDLSVENYKGQVVNMKSKEIKFKKKHFTFFLLTICILVFSWFSSMYWVTGGIYFFDSKENYCLNLKNDENVSYKFKDLETLDENTYQSLSDDSYLVVEFTEAVIVKDIMLDISLKDDTANCQVYYATSDSDFTEDHSVRKKIQSGKNLIQIKSRNYNKIRFDFVDESNTEFIVNSINLYKAYVPKDVFWISCVLSVVLIGIAFLYIYKDTINNKAIYTIMLRWSNLSIRKRNLIGLMAVSTISMGIVFLKLCYSHKIFAYGDIGSDTIMQYLPQYSLIVNKISNGTISLWLPEVGYGYNLAYFFMASPLLLLLLLSGVVLGTQSLPILVIIYKVAGVLLCAYVSFRLLEMFSDNYNIILIGAYLYAFNGFAIIWGQHYVFFDYPLYAICVFYFIERWLRIKDKKFDLALILISFACMAFSVYMSYMVYIPVCIYAIIRYIQLNKQFRWKEFISSMFHLALNIFIGFVGGFSTGLLYVKNILNSGRVSSETSLIERFVGYLKTSYLKDDFLGSLQRFLSSNLYGIGSAHEGLHNYYEEPQLFFSVLFWVIFFQFVFTIHKTCINRKQMVCKWISVILVTMAIYNKGILFALYAFSQESRRTTFSLFPILAIMVVVVLDNIISKKILSKMGLLLGGCISIVLLLFNYRDFLNLEKQILLIVSTIVLVTAIIVLLIFCIQKNYVKEQNLIIILTVAIFLNVTTEVYVSVNRIGLVEETWIQKDGIKLDTQEAIDYLKENDNTYYRMEKTYATWNGLTDSFFEGYYPVSTYNPTMSHYTKEYNELFMNPMFLSTRWYKPRFILSPNDIIQYSSLGLKYVLSNHRLSDSQHYKLVKKVNDIYIYQNLEAESFTTFFDNLVLKNEFEKLEYIDRNKVQQKALIIDDEDAEKFQGRVKSIQQVLSGYKEVELTKCINVDGKDITHFYNKKIDYDMEVNFSNSWFDYVNGTAFLELKIDPMAQGTIRIFYDTGSGYNEQECDYIYCGTEECQIRYILPDKTEKIKLMFSSVPSNLIELKIMDSLEEIKNSDNQSVLYEGENSSQINGCVYCDRDGLLYIPLTYDTNWKVKIDGEEVDTYLANSGFLAVTISEGNHEIEIVYDSIEIKIGLLCFVIAIIIAYIYYFLCKRDMKDLFLGWRMNG